MFIPWSFTDTDFPLQGCFRILSLDGKNSAVVLGIIDGAVGILVCILVMLGMFSDTQGEHLLTFRPDIIFLIIYLLKLVKIKSRWEKSVP
jgi:hypothetical protein